MSTSPSPVVRARPSSLPVMQVGIALVFLVLSLLMALGLAPFLYQLVFLDKIHRGVQVLGADLSKMSRSEAKTAVSVRADAYLDFPVTLRYADQEWTFSARQLGATLDVDQMVDEAYAVGRDGDLIQNLEEQFRVARQGIEVKPVLGYDTGPSNALLTQVAQSVDRPARDARLIIHPGPNLEAMFSQTGLAVDIDATRDLIHEWTLNRDSAPIQLVVLETPASVTEVDEARRRAEDLLASSLTFTAKFGDQSQDFVLTPDQVAQMSLVTEEINPEGIGKVVFSPDDSKWSTFVNGLAPSLRLEPVDARFEIDPDSGAIKVLRPSRPGQALDVNGALGLAAGLYSDPARHVDLPVVPIPAAVPMEQVDAMGFTALVAEATTYFEGSSEARMRNIQVAASKFHGVVIAPGDVFSFNQYLGPVTSETGFEESLIIWGDKTMVGIGGGVCQVSTTAFRAAFFSGLEIVERWAHGYRVNWYEIDSEPGLDATIYAPDVDLRFRNDTGDFLLIQTETDLVASTITFRFYSQPTGREVKTEGPLIENVRSPEAPVYREEPSLAEGTVKQIEWEKDGADVTVRRIVTEGDVVIHQDTFVSLYQPWQAEFLVGTGSDNQ